MYRFYCVYPFFMRMDHLLAIWKRMHHFIGYIWNEIGGVFFNYVQNHAGGWLEFHFIVRALPGSYLDQVILLVWSNMDCAPYIKSYTYLLFNKK